MKKLKYMYYRFMWTIAPLLPNGKLVHVDIELNNNCNQRCLSCWHSKNKLPFKIKQMNLFNVYRILRESRNMGALSVKFNLRGEPTLYKNLVDVISYAKYQGFVDIMINTNGILLDLEFARKLSKAGLTTCIISVDSLWDENYCYIHNCSSKDYFKLMTNLGDLHVFTKYKEIAFKTKLNFHINTYNQNENFAEYAKKFYMFGIVTRYTEQREGHDITIERESRKRKKMCPQMKRRLTITADNKIYPCCVCYLEPQDIQLVGDRVDAAWISEKRKKLIKDYKKKIYTESCKNCTSGDIWK